MINGESVREECRGSTENPIYPRSDGTQYCVMRRWTDYSTLVVAVRATEKSLYRAIRFLKQMLRPEIGVSNIAQLHCHYRKAFSSRR